MSGRKLCRLELDLLSLSSLAADKWCTMSKVLLQTETPMGNIKQRCRDLLSIMSTFLLVVC